jgi:hypothetical protein
VAHKHLFVYGTLRPCDARWAEDGEVAPPQQGTTPGALYNYGGFPYADFDGDGTITGDILTMDGRSSYLPSRTPRGTRRWLRRARGSGDTADWSGDRVPVLRC